MDNQLKKYKVSILVPYEFYVEASNFNECMEKVQEQIPSQYNGDSIRISFVDNNKNENILFEDFPRR